MNTNKFDLAGMIVGDWFLGCNDCLNQYEKNTACKPICDNCGSRMNKHIVENENGK